MNARVIRRFVVLMIVMVFVVVIGTDLIRGFMSRPPGDFNTERGTNQLSDGQFADALQHFDDALKEQHDHRGALMGRALVFVQTERYPEAIAEFTYLIDKLKQDLEPDDINGKGVLAGAYANRGIVHDRQGRHKKALDDYIMALKTDEGAVEGPGLVHKILYASPRASSVRKRAQYLYEQFKKPPAERLMRVPEIDAKERMYKP